jgi:hypothetical protein
VDSAEQVLYELLGRLLRHLTEPGKRVLNIRCQTGFLLNAVRPGYGVGVDISASTCLAFTRLPP